MPEPLEAQLATLAENGVFEKTFEDLKPFLEARDALLGQLDDIAAELPPTEPGPQRVGTLRDLRRGNLVRRWAGTYLHAFCEGYRVFPYVETEKPF